MRRSMLRQGVTDKGIGGRRELLVQHAVPVAQPLGETRSLSLLKTLINCGGKPFRPIREQRP
ncbi:hypothetical protein D9M70_601610 [compost metagenome]